MSAGVLVTLDDLVEANADEIRRDEILRDLAVSPGFAHHLGETACEVRRLRCHAEPDPSLAYLADRLAGHVESLWLLFAPTAAASRLASRSTRRSDRRPAHGRPAWTDGRKP